MKTQITIAIINIPTLQVFKYHGRYTIEYSKSTV